MRAHKRQAIRGYKLPRVRSPSQSLPKRCNRDEERDRHLPTLEVGLFTQTEVLEVLITLIRIGCSVLPRSLNRVPIQFCAVSPRSTYGGKRRNTESEQSQSERKCRANSMLAGDAVLGDSLAFELTRLRVYLAMDSSPLTVQRSKGSRASVESIKPRASMSSANICRSAMRKGRSRGRRRTSPGLGG